MDELILLLEEILESPDVEEIHLLAEKAMIIAEEQGEP